MLDRVRCGFAEKRCHHRPRSRFISTPKNNARPVKSLAAVDRAQSTAKLQPNVPLLIVRQTEMELMCRLKAAHRGTDLPSSNAPSVAIKGLYVRQNGHAQP